MAGEANAHAMNATHIPASEEELDRWLVTAKKVGATGGFGTSVVVLTFAVERLVGEVVLTRSLHRIHHDKLEDEKRAERANAVLLQRAEQRITELQREVDEVTTQRNQALAGRPVPMPCPACGVAPLCFIERDGVRRCVACSREMKL